MNNKEIFKIWLAGFIDGEGCIYLAKTNTKKRSKSGFQITLRLEIAQSDIKLLEYIKSEIGFGSNVWNKTRDRIFQCYTGKEYLSKKSYAIKFSSNQALKVLEQVYPYLIVKKEQARLAIEFQKTAVSLGNNKTKEYYDNQLLYLIKIKQLKHIAP